MDEMVAVVPRTWAERVGLLRYGAHAVAADIVSELEARASFLSRSLAEEATDWIQPIPYVVLRAGDEVFVMERLAGGTESRLHGKRSVGVGGHLHPADAADPRGLIAAGLDREWGEELDVPAVPHLCLDGVLAPSETLRPTGAKPAQWVGVVHDDTIAVGRVHVGLVFVVDVAAQTRAVVRESHKLVGGWLPVADVLQDEARLETWSAFALRLLANANANTPALLA